MAASYACADAPSLHHWGLFVFTWPWWMVAVRGWLDGDSMSRHESALHKASEDNSMRGL